jgi:hypothetical protein
MTRDPAPGPDDAVARINARNARTLDRVDAAVWFLVRLVALLLLVCGGVWALLHWCEPCPLAADGTATLCGLLLPLARFGRRQTAPAAPDTDTDTSTDTAAPECADLLLRLARDSFSAGQQTGYVTGARAGRLAGFCWGFALGALLVAGAFALGVQVGR